MIQKSNGSIKKGFVPDVPRNKVIRKNNRYHWQCNKIIISLFKILLWGTHESWCIVNYPLIGGPAWLGFLLAIFQLNLQQARARWVGAILRTKEMYIYIFFLVRTLQSYPWNIISLIISIIMSNFFSIPMTAQTGSVGMQ